MEKNLYIDASHPNETRVVLKSNGNIEDYEYEGIKNNLIKNNIYLGKVSRVEPSLQAAFVDFGRERHGFLSFNDIQSDYYQIPHEDRDKLKSVINAALNEGKKLNGVDPTKVAAIGYCFGGLVVLDLARSGADVKGVVSFHGLLMDSKISEQGIKSKVLVLHGERDPMVPPVMVNEFQKEMTEAGADWQLHSYGNAYHSFTNKEANDPDLGTQYHEDADKRSWQSMMNFFSEIL